MDTNTISTYRSRAAILSTVFLTIYYKTSTKYSFTRQFHSHQYFNLLHNYLYVLKEPNCIMDLWCDQICGSINDNSSWRASIYMPSTYFTISDVTGIHLPEAVSDPCNTNPNDMRNDNFEEHATESTGITINRNKMNNSDVTIIESDNNRSERWCTATNEAMIVNNQERMELKDTNVTNQNLKTNVASNKVDQIDILNFLYPPLELDSKRKVLCNRKTKNRFVHDIFC